MRPGLLVDVVDGSHRADVRFDASPGMTGTDLIWHVEFEVDARAGLWQRVTETLVGEATSNLAAYLAPEEVFTREDVPGRGKPLPDMFLLAASKMQVDASDCIVVEDSTSGIRAAQAANMDVIGYLGGGHAQSAWYREKIGEFAIPLTYTDGELLALLQGEA